MLLHYGRLYSQSNVPQSQTEFGYLSLCIAHRLQLEYGEQLLPRVDDLALHMSNMKHRHMGIILIYQPCEMLSCQGTVVPSFTNYLTTTIPCKLVESYHSQNKPQSLYVEV